MRALFAAPLFALLSGTAFASDQAALDACIASWGKDSPFRKGTPASSTIGTGVKVFGIGSAQSGNDGPTDKPGARRKTAPAWARWTRATRAWRYSARCG